MTGLDRFDISVSILYACIKMRSEERRESEVKLNPVSLFVETFTVVGRRRPGSQRALVLLATLGFVLFETPFPIDDNLLFIHLKVTPGLRQDHHVDISSRISLVGLRRTLQTSKPYGLSQW